jgi:hypothetical protein
LPAPDDYDDGEIGGMIGMGNWSTRRKPTPVPLCQPQNPHAYPDAKPGRRCGKPATNRLSYGTACTHIPSLSCIQKAGIFDWSALFCCWWSLPQPKLSIKEDIWVHKQY